MEKVLKSFYTIRFPDCDPFGHLNNSRYIDYMLNAREDHLKEFYGLKLASFYKKGFGWMVSKHEIQYLKPALYNEKICIQSGLIDTGDSHVTVEITMWDEAVKKCKAVLWSSFISVNLKTGKRENHEEEFTQFLQTVHIHDVNIAAGQKERIAVLLSEQR
ncbi:MAG: acyl-CoA thioesterase [Chitinophagaceae bacterium]